MFPDFNEVLYNHLGYDTACGPHDGIVSCPGQAPWRDGLPAVEARLAFVDEGLSGFAVVLGEPGVRMVGHFQVHAFT